VRGRAAFARLAESITRTALSLSLLQVVGCAGNPAPPRPDAGTDAGTDAGMDAFGPRDPALQNGNADELFAATSVPTFDIVLPAEVWEALKVNARDEQFVPVEASYQGRSLGTVGLRFKGYYGSLINCFDAQGKMTCPRLSMKIKFDEYVSGQRFFGLKRLAFNAYLHDDSRMKEKLAYDLFRAMGIVAPRAAWAILRVNGVSQGLYGMVEPVDGRFTADRWPSNPDGNLYKELWPTNAPDQKIISALETNEKTANIANYRAFSQAFTAADETNLLPTLSRYMDPDYLARFLAVEDAFISYDGITYFWTDGTQDTNHNFFVYEESPTRFTLIPWDVESGFWINPNHAPPHWTVTPADCNLTYAYWDGLAHAPGCDRVLRALNSDLTRWRAAARTLLDGPFSVDTMGATIERYRAVIGDAARADPTPVKYSAFDPAVASLRSLIPNMRARLETLIAQ
jgi:hypothetical protein